MKRIFRTLSLVAMVALVATSCNKNEQTTSFNVSFDEVKGFQAGPSLDGTKAYFDPNGAFRWNEDDAVVVYNLAKNSANSECAVYDAAEGSEGKTQTSFFGEPIGAKQDIGYFVFYHPSKAQRAVKNNDNKEVFTVSPTQTYQAYDGQFVGMDHTSMVMACTTEQSNGHADGFVLQHIFGYLNVAIADNVGGKHVENIVVTDGKWNLTGNLEIKLPAVSAQRFTELMNMCENNNANYLTALSSYLGELEYYASGTQSKTVTLDCGNYELPWRKWQYFFISLRPGALYEGFTVRINYSDNTYAEHEFAPSMNYLIKPGYFRNVYFTTAQGFLQ